MANDVALTPMMKQYFEFKAQHPDAVLLFRCGDFYETYSEDAIIASDILGITLTKRANGGQQKVVEMAGFPHHALDTYLPKLIRAGKRVAICDQLEDPKLAKKLVKRGITELVTPGVSINDNVLNYKENNFLAAVHFGKTACGVAFLDISTGEFLTAEGTTDYVDKLLGNFAPKEVLYERGRRAMFEGNFGSKFVTYELDDWVFTEQTAMQKLLRHFETRNLKGFGVEHLKMGIIASGAILQYLEITQHTQIGHITTLARIEEERYVRLDKFTVRSLELVGSMNEGGTSLLDVIDHTISPMGARLLKRWMVFPLTSKQQIDQRLDVVEYFFREPEFKQLIEEQLHLMGDLERIISKVAVGRVNPRELVQLRTALQAIEPVKRACEKAGNESLRRIGEQLNVCEVMRDRIAREIKSDPPVLLNKGGVMADGMNAELDELRHIAFSGKDYLIQIQQRESELTGIPSLKIGYNNVFGYYIEVRNAHKDKVPAGWIRKQTLANAERYITPELKEYEEKILGAEEKIITLENKLYNELVAALTEYITTIQVNANQLARLDCLLSFANVAAAYRYVRPVIDESDVLDIRQGRHPVIERQMPVGENYVANDVMLDSQTQQIIIITGPNMAGKSALLMLRPGGQRAHRTGGQDIHPRRSERQHLGGRIDLHGRDERGGQHPQQPVAAQPGALRRAGTRHVDLRRHLHSLGHRGVHPRASQGQGAHALRHPLSRAERDGEVLPAHQELQRVGEGSGQQGHLPAQAGARRKRTLLRHPRGAPASTWRAWRACQRASCAAPTTSSSSWSATTASRASPTAPCLPWNRHKAACSSASSSWTTPCSARYATSCSTST